MAYGGGVLMVWRSAKLKCERSPAVPKCERSPAVPKCERSSAVQSLSGLPLCI